MRLRDTLGPVATDQQFVALFPSHWQPAEAAPALEAIAAATIARIEQGVEAATVTELARRFTALVRACGTGRDRSRRVLALS